MHDVVGVDRHRRRHGLRRDPRRGLAQQLPELALEVPHARFPRVVDHDAPQRVVADRHVGGGEPVALQLASQQVVARDLHLLVLGVAVEADHLEAVQERAGDGLEHVRRGQEQHVGQVEIDLEVVVAERVVLRGVEHLEQRRRRVTPPVGPELVDLVEDDDRVHGARIGERAHDATGP